MLLKSQLIELFKDDTILQYELSVTLLDSQGRKKEEGTGVGVTKEIFSVFFTEFLSSYQMKCPALDTICQDLSGALLPVF